MRTKSDSKQCLQHHLGVPSAGGLGPGRKGEALPVQQERGGQQVC